MGCRACAGHQQQQSSKNRPATLAPRGQNTKGEQPRGATSRNNMRFNGL